MFGLFRIVLSKRRGEKKYTVHYRCLSFLCGKSLECAVVPLSAGPSSLFRPVSSVLTYPPALAGRCFCVQDGCLAARVGFASVLAGGY